MRIAFMERLLGCTRSRSCLILSVIGLGLLIGLFLLLLYFWFRTPDHFFLSVPIDVNTEESEQRIEYSVRLKPGAYGFWIVAKPNPGADLDQDQQVTLQCQVLLDVVGHTGTRETIVVSEELIFSAKQLHDSGQRTSNYPLGLSPKVLGQEYVDGMSYYLVGELIWIRDASKLVAVSIKVQTESPENEPNGRLSDVMQDLSVKLEEFHEGWQLAE